MQQGIPSTLDFLTLCRANNQQLAADKLNTMLSKVWKPCLFKWKTNVINENNFELPHNDYIIATPLSLAAKYGNTAICKVLIEKRQHQLSLSTKTLFYLYDKKFITNYNGYMQEGEKNYYYSAFDNAIKYNNFETAEYIYTIYEAKSNNKNYVAEQLIRQLKNAKNILQLEFLLKKMDCLLKNKDLFDMYDFMLFSCRLLSLCTSWIKKNNWEFISYIITKHIDIIKNYSPISIKKILYETLKNNNLDIALVLIKNVSKDNIFNTKEDFNSDNISGDFTFLEIITKNCDTETIEWFHQVINSE